MRAKLSVAAVVALVALPAAASADTLVTVGSPSTPFPQNKQNEPRVAIDPSNPSVLAAGSNDEIDLAPCDGSDCPFTQGVGVSGVYLSFNGGASWGQPTYTGFSARTGTPGTGPIGTLPNYDTHGLASDGDPVLAFGPRRGSSGRFSWSNGSRLYYGNLTANFSTVRKEAAFKGFEAVAVSYTDSVSAAAAGSNSAWSAPVIVTQTRQSSTTFSDKPDVWADNASSSPFFGNVYVCYAQFRSQQEAGPVPITITRSTDGGATWSKPNSLSNATKDKNDIERQGCQVRTDSRGGVYAFWHGSDHGTPAQFMDRSFDGGVRWERPRVVAHVTDVGQFDLVRSISFDGIAGARTGSLPTVDLANGAPTGAGAPDTIALGWADARNGLNHEQALVQLSGDRGVSWTSPANVAESSDRPDFPAVALSPNGRDLYAVYDAFVDPFRNDTTSTRRFQGVVRHADVGAGGALSGLATTSRGPLGDARASSANGLIDEFIGDYNYAMATNSAGVEVWNDARNAAVCGDVNDYRQDVANGVDSAAPAPATECPATFGNTDIFGTATSDPTP
jgi:hypothetical protein